MRFDHDIDFTVYGRTRDDIETKAHARAAEFFGGSYSMSITSHRVETYGGDLVHWRADVHAFKETDR